MPTWDELAQQQNSRKVYTAEITLARPDGLGGIETTTRLLSDRAIRPDLTDVYYEPRLGAIPYINAALQDVMLGQSQATYGQLEILSPDGGLDPDVVDWYWAGQPVVIKLGFDVLPVGEFRPVFTGRMGGPKPGDTVITVPIVDYQRDLLAAMLPDGDYAGTIPNLVQACLSEAGITAIDQAAWDAWAAANNFPAWFRSQSRPISSVMDDLLAPLACWSTFDQAGAFVVGNLELPNTDSPALSLIDDIEALDFAGDEWGRQYWKVSVEYLTATGDSPDYATVSQEDGTIKALNPSATESAARRSCLTSEDDANTVKARWWSLFSGRRRVWSVSAKVLPLTLKLHDQVYLQRDRFSIAQNYRVVGLKKEPARNRATMELLA